MTRTAYRADGRSCTAEAFYALACDPARSAVVEACAGAGKTWMLVSRILRALLAGAQPREILAITFTRKAAGEMRERLQDWLAALAAATHEQRVDELRLRGLTPAEAEALAPTLGGLQARLLATGQGVQVHTFHAWFSQLMRGAPLELLDGLGLHPGMALIEEVEDLRPELMRRFQAAVLADAALAADYRALVDRHGRSRLSDWLQAALTRRVEIELADQVGALDAAVAAPWAIWPEAVDGVEPVSRLCADALLRQRLLAAARAIGAIDKLEHRKAAARLEHALGQDDPRAAFDAAWQALVTDKGTPRLALVDLPEVRAALEALERIERMQCQFEAHQDHGRMARLARTLLAAWRETKRSHGVADMDDLERCALAVLRDATLAGWVQERLDARVRHVLIDEFQDTSPLQWHALEGWLGAYAGAGGGASGQQPPSVFIVGDPKQSIYRFRRAEPRVFAAARDLVVQGLDGVLLECDHTRRNAPGVLEALNAVFTAASASGEFEGFRAHTTEVPDATAGEVRSLPEVVREPRRTRAGTTDDPPVWRDTLTEPKSEPEQRLRAAEAAQVAAAIDELLRCRGMPAGEVMVLGRRRVMLAQVEEALRARGLPCVAADEAALAALPEARDLIALLDLLASPGHDLSLAQALKSPVFDAGDDDLLVLAQRAAAQAQAWWPALAGWLDAPPALARARTLIAGWLEAAQALPPHDLLDRVVHQGDVVGRMVAAAPPGRRVQAEAAVRGLLAQALALDGGRYATPYNFVRALRRRALGVHLPAQRDAVRLLTVHGAKGLEADAVFVVDADPVPPQGSSPGVLVDWPVHAPRPRCVALLANLRRPPPSLAELHATEQEAAAREELNGLYVAMTRARRHLVLSRTPASRTAGPGPSWWQRVAPLAAPWVPEPGLASPATGAASVTVAGLPPHAAPASGAAVAVAVEGSDPAAGLGRAVHRALEWMARPRAGVDLAAAARAAASEFGLDAAEGAVVARIAGTILASPELAPFFDPASLRWAGNEVALAEAGAVLRIDRLVQLAADGQWWVLDYKLASRPDLGEAARAQLMRYRDAVQALQPGDRVRAGFVNAQGRLIEI